MQAYTLRCHYLPHLDDSDESLGMAVWLHRNQQTLLADAVAIGISKALGG